MPKTNLLAFVLITAFLIAGWWSVKTFVLEQPKDRDGAGAKAKQEAVPNKEVAKAKDEGEPKGDKDAGKPKEPVEQKDNANTFCKCKPMLKFLHLSLLTRKCLG